MCQPVMFFQILDRFSGIFFDAFDENSGVNKASGDGDPEAFVRSCNEEQGLLVWQNRYRELFRSSRILMLQHK